MSQRNQVLEALWRLEQMDVVNMPENTMPKGTLDRLEDLEVESNTAKLEGEIVNGKLVYEAVGVGLDRYLSRNGVRV